MNSSLLNVLNSAFTSLEKNVTEEFITRCFNRGAELICKEWVDGIHEPITNLRALGHALALESKKSIILSEIVLDLDMNMELDKRIKRDKDHSRYRKDYRPLILIHKDSVPMRFYLLQEYSKRTITVSNGDMLSQTFTKDEARNFFMISDEDYTSLIGFDCICKLSKNQVL